MWKRLPGIARRAGPVLRGAMIAKKNENHGGRGSSSFHSRPKPDLSRHTHALDGTIGKKLRAMYDDLVQQPLPEGLVELLRKLDQRQESKSQ